MAEKPERLDKFISGQLQITRNDAKEFLKQGKVTVNGSIQKRYEYKVTPGTDSVAVDGEIIQYRKYIYIMLNKPKGVVCSTRDGESPTVLSLIPENLMRKGLFPAGRLDKDTEGFVLLTDDGEFAHRMLSPKHHVNKLYYCELEKPYQNVYEPAFKEGLTLKTGEKCLPAEIKKGDTEYSAYVTLHEGMFHQVKRMLETVGNKVLYLKRVKIGGLLLDENLELGECREILHKELQKIF